MTSLDIDFLITFFGWCTIISFGILLISSSLVILMKDKVSTLHSHIFGVPSDKVLGYYFDYLAKLKIISISLFFVPYLA